MAKISKSDVMHLAALSNVSLDDSEAEDLRTDLEAIVGYIGQLSDLNTKGVEPTYQVGGLQNVWREDVLADESVSRDALLALAPDRQNNQIKVPKVL